MNIAPKPKDEARRLLKLKEFNLLDTAEEKQFDEIVSLASFICKTPISTITLIDETRQWFKSQVGLTNRETPRDVSFCAHAILSNDIMVVNDASKDQRFFDNPLVTGAPDIRFYAGVPLTTSDGYNVGTLCVIDRKPRTLSPEQEEALTKLRNQVLYLFELKRKNIELQRIQQQLHRILSIVGHDLRAPVTSIKGLLLLDEKHALSIDDYREALSKVHARISDSNDLLSNLLQWAKTVIEGEFDSFESIDLMEELKRVSSPLKELLNEKANVLTFSADHSIRVLGSKDKLAFVLRNLVLNANKYTDNGRIQITANAFGGVVTVSVIDDGVGVPPEVRDQLFAWGRPSQAKGTRGEGGSGLGLPMSKDFIEEMGGTIWFEPLAKGTAFHFTLQYFVDNVTSTTVE